MATWTKNNIFFPNVLHYIVIYFFIYNCIAQRDIPVPNIFRLIAGYCCPSIWPSLFRHIQAIYDTAGLTFLFLFGVSMCPAPSCHNSLKISDRYHNKKTFTLIQTYIGIKPYKMVFKLYIAELESAKFMLDNRALYLTFSHKSTLVSIVSCYVLNWPMSSIDISRSADRNI